MSYRVGAVALGSNLGDREKQLMRAVRKLERTEGVIVLRRSDWIESAPVGGPAGQGLYLNGVMLIETELEALALLEVLHRIEAQLGREREAENERNMPRTIDLDLLFLGDLVLEDKAIRLPHPRMDERIFVLEPLAQLSPDHLLPSGVTVAERLDALRAKLADPDGSSTTASNAEGIA